MLEIKELSVCLGKKQVLEPVSFALPQNSITAIIGKNGSGKSTLLKALCGLVPGQGSVLWQGAALKAMSPRQRAQTLSYLPQLLQPVHITVQELVALGRNPYLSLSGRLSAQDEQAVAYALERTGAARYRQCFADEISGGERQNAYLAMVLAQNTPLLLLDEPTACLDMDRGQEMLQLLCSLRQQEGKTVLVVLHDIGQAMRCAGHILALRQGKAVFFGTTEECLAQNVPEKEFGLRRFSVNDGGKRLLFFTK